jgi:hypothetical protein
MGLSTPRQDSGQVRAEKGEPACLQERPAIDGGMIASFASHAKNLDCEPSGYDLTLKSNTC